MLYTNKVILIIDIKYIKKGIQHIVCRFKKKKRKCQVALEVGRIMDGKIHRISFYIFKPVRSTGVLWLCGWDVTLFNKG